MNNMSNTMFNMIVLMTTSNYPDVMLPAYQANRAMCVFFIVYLFVGLFVIMNLLLAIIFNIFKDNYSRDVIAAEDTRTEYMEKRFYQISEEKEYLDKIGMYKYFIIIHSLVSGTYQDIFNEKDEINM